MFDFIKKLLTGSGEGEIKRLNVIVRKVEALEERYKAMSDDELRGQTALFKERVKKGESLDDLLPEAFAVVREGAWRSVGMRHFPVQILGGIVLHQGRIAEMKTGEGKTLVATLPAYLNALTGNGVHIVTVNDYLARYHSEWMGKVYRFLGLSVAWCCTIWTARPERPPITRILPTPPTTSWASITCATTWSPTVSAWCSAP